MGLGYAAGHRRGEKSSPAPGAGPPGGRPATSDEREAAVPVHMELKRIIISEVHEQQVIMLK